MWLSMRWDRNRSSIIPTISWDGLGAFHWAQHSIRLKKPCPHGQPDGFHNPRSTVSTCSFRASNLEHIFRIPGHQPLCYGTDLFDLWIFPVEFFGLLDRRGSGRESLSNHTPTTFSPRLILNRRREGKEMVESHPLKSSTGDRFLLSLFLPHDTSTEPYGYTSSLIPLDRPTQMSVATFVQSTRVVSCRRTSPRKTCTHLFHRHLSFSHKMQKQANPKSKSGQFTGD